MSAMYGMIRNCSISASEQKKSQENLRFAFAKNSQKKKIFRLLRARAKRMEIIYKVHFETQHTYIQTPGNESPA